MFWLNNNKLTGPIPSWLGNLTELKQLLINDNVLTGSIPSSLTNLMNLNQLYLTGNDLSGCIPPSLHDLPENDLDRLSLSDCEE